MRFRITVDADALSTEKLGDCGFALKPQSGDTILPTPMGPVSHRNAHGHYVVRKDLPKEYRYVRTIEWSWQEFNGPYDRVERTDDKDIYQRCYPRDFYPPPSSELTIMELSGQLLIVSEELINFSANEKRILHIINLFLELFGECDIRYADLQTITPVEIRKVNWIFLPPGQYPWSRVRQHVNQVLGNKSPSSANPILHRFDKLDSLKPATIYVGRGGFRYYVAYIFERKGLAVLESVMLNNATYVFDQDWERLSQMTKAEILQANLQYDRIIHTKNWYDRIEVLLR